jgi:hypothetical protein
MYSNQELMGNDVTVLPIIMGMGEQVESDIAELEDLGWKRFEP